MTVAQLRELLQIYGANAERWPQAERAAARALLAASAEARALLADYAPVDRLMEAGDDAAPAGLLERIMAATGDDDAN